MENGSFGLLLPSWGVSGDRVELRGSRVALALGLGIPLGAWLVVRGTHAAATSDSVNLVLALFGGGLTAIVVAMWGLWRARTRLVATRDGIRIQGRWIAAADVVDVQLLDRVEDRSAVPVPGGAYSIKMEDLNRWYLCVVTNDLGRDPMIRVSSRFGHSRSAPNAVVSFVAEVRRVVHLPARQPAPA